MDFFLNDTEIQSLIKEEKRLSKKLSDLSKMKIKKGHKEGEVSVKRADGSEFKIILRQSIHNQMDFSVILGFVPVNRTDIFILRRYNGKSHEHTNKLEIMNPFYDFHIHTATERYQKEGRKEEFYAETTDRYSDLRSAVDCLIKDCNIIFEESQYDLGI